MLAVSTIGWGFLGLAAISAGFLVFSIVRLARAHAPVVDPLSAAPTEEPVPAAVPAADVDAAEVAPAPRESADEER